MTLKELVILIKDIASKQPNVHSVVDYFTDLNNEEQQYSAIILQHLEYDLSSNTYIFYLGYTDRLNSSSDNEIDIYSIGCEILRNISNAINDDERITGVSMGRTIPLKQKFSADCACVYTQISISLPYTDCYVSYDEYVI